MIEFDFYDLDLNTRKLCSGAVYRDEKLKNILAAYYSLLNEDEKTCFEKYSEQFHQFAKRGAKKYKITKNAILIALRLKNELGVTCYPFIEKVATRGWGTDGGTFSWSMRILSNSAIEQEICSLEPASMFINKKYKLTIGPYNGFTVVSAE